LQQDSLKRTFRHLPADSPKEELEKARLEFPTIIKMDDNSLWCTHLHESNPQIAGAYEIENARWIPGDPWGALKAIFLLGRLQDQATFERLLLRAKSGGNQ
jgi:hypothetical protein